MRRRPINLWEQPYETSKYIKKLERGLFTTTAREGCIKVFFIPILGFLCYWAGRGCAAAP